VRFEAARKTSNPAPSAFTNNAADGGAGGLGANGGGALGSNIIAAVHRSPDRARAGLPRL
jgi:hypothetical protein